MPLEVEGGKRRLDPMIGRTISHYRIVGKLGGLAGKMDPITLKHYGSAEARQKAGARRSTELWTTVWSVLGREILLKP